MRVLFFVLALGITSPAFGALNEVTYVKQKSSVGKFVPARMDEKTKSFLDTENGIFYELTVKDEASNKMIWIVYDIQNGGIMLREPIVANESELREAKDAV